MVLETYRDWVSDVMIPAGSPALEAGLEREDGLKAHGARRGSDRLLLTVLRPHEVSSGSAGVSRA